MSTVSIAPHSALRFASVILDVDSTLAGIEGIDWLAERRGADVARDVAALTDRAMQGEIALESVYGHRMAMVRPSRTDLEALANAYCAAVAPNAAATLARLHEHGVQVALVSGGLRNAILPLAASLGVSSDMVHAVDVYLDDHGAYAGYDQRSPLTTQQGKLRVAQELSLPAPVLAVGDGATDVAMRPAVDAFAAFTGFVHRAPVVASADFVLHSFDELIQVVMP